MAGLAFTSLTDLCLIRMTSKHTVWQAGTGTLYIQKLAHRYNRAPKKRKRKEKTTVTR